MRLTEGDYSTSEAMTRSAEDSIQFYNQFESVDRIHIIDLIGAKAQRAIEMDYIQQLIQASDKPIEVGVAFVMRLRCDAILIQVSITVLSAHKQLRIQHGSLK